MKRPAVILVPIMIGMVILLFFVQKDLRNITGNNWQRENLTYLPGSEQIKPVFLGFETTVAHYLWIRTLLYFGTHALTDSNYPWLIEMLTTITKLCPWFYPAYEFAGIMLPDVCNNPEAARIILERGLTALGNTKWNISFNMGMIYYKYYDDRRMAADYFARAALVPGAPQAKLTTMADAFYRQAGFKNEGMMFLLFSYETSDNPEVRRHLAEKIHELQSN